VKLQVKDLDISTGGIMVVVIHRDDAARLDLHHSDRITIKKGRKETVAVVNISESEKAVAPGEIGLFEEVLSKVNAKQNDNVSINLAEKPLTLTYIKKKLAGEELSDKEIDEIVQDVVKNRLTDIELTYFVAGTYTTDMNLKERVALTKSMMNTGGILKLRKYPVVDKHCIGGVAGNRTTMVLVPLLIAAGLTVPKTSSRAITSPAGTADVMEVLTEVSMDIKKMKKVVNKVGGCMVWGGAVDLAPADDVIINVERPISLDPEAQLLASIMAKKGSVSATHVLIDIPVGKDAKIESRNDALHLKKEFEKIAKELKMKVEVMVTDGSEPIGNGIGPALEARDALWILENDVRAPQDLKNKALRMASVVLEMTGKAKKGEGIKLAVDLLKTGRAYEKMVEIIVEQGAKILDPHEVKIGKYKFEYIAARSGTVKHINNKAISKVARIAGCPNDTGAGIYLMKHKGDKVKKGEVLFELYAENRAKLEFAKKVLFQIDGFTIG